MSQIEVARSADVKENQALAVKAGATPLLQRDPAALLKLALGVSVLFNLLLVVWLLFLPH